jgi:NAD(P)H dehydrogenase (quinone)
MNILVVFAHPRRESFTGALLDHFVGGLQQAGHVPEIADLYREGFNPCLGEADYAQFSKDSPMPEDVLHEQKRVEAAEGLAFVFPVWWWSFPAILKGWVDRVFSQGWAYDFSLEKVTGLLHLQKAVLLGSGGSSHQAFRKYGYYDAMQRQMDVGLLRYCGVRSTAIYVFPGVDDLAATRPAYLEKARQVGLHFAESDPHPVGVIE